MENITSLPLCSVLVLLQNPYWSLVLLSGSPHTGQVVKIIMFQPCWRHDTGTLQLCLPAWQADISLPGEEGFLQSRLRYTRPNTPVQQDNLNMIGYGFLLGSGWLSYLRFYFNETSSVDNNLHIRAMDQHSLMRIRIQQFFWMRTRIQEVKWMWIHADPDLAEQIL